MRIALAIEFDGTRFLGWQSQAQRPTVQQTVEDALSLVGNHPIEVHGAGRTDSGVHATAMIAHFDSTANRSMRSWVLGANANLPNDVVVLWAIPVEDSFHARYEAIERRYCYRICNRWVRPVQRRLNRAWIRKPLDADRMQRAAQALLGEHDFTSYRALSCQARHAVRELTRVHIERHRDDVICDVHGNAFLHHMVRNIVGSLIEVGRGDHSESWIAEVLVAKDRTLAGMTAPACGLTLESIRYPDAVRLPEKVREIHT